MIQEWSARHETGVAELDEQHKALLEAAHRLHDVIITTMDQEEALSAVGFLARYARNHFDREEALMRDHLYPDGAHHREIHARFLSRLEDLKDEILHAEVGNQFLADRALDLTQNWLFAHIAAETAPLARFLQKQRPPQER